MAKHASRTSAWYPMREHRLGLRRGKPRHRVDLRTGLVPQFEFTDIRLVLAELGARRRHARRPRSVFLMLAK